MPPNELHLFQSAVHGGVYARLEFGHEFYETDARRTSPCNSSQYITTIVTVRVPSITFFVGKEGH